MKVPFVDFKDMHGEIRDDLDQAYKKSDGQQLVHWGAVR